MAILGAVMKFDRERREELFNKLEKISGVSWQQDSPDGDFILLIEAANIEALHKLCTELEKIDGVRGLYPSYVTTDD
ncbi:MAG: chaperone NapD [Selenomonadaceae bacterium]|nr:chaperone NapD [Selenomonadaceae bacterium]